MHGVGHELESVPGRCYYSCFNHPKTCVINKSLANIYGEEKRTEFTCNSVLTKKSKFSVIRFLL